VSYETVGCCSNSPIINCDCDFCFDSDSDFGFEHSLGIRENRGNLWNRNEGIPANTSQKDGGNHGHKNVEGDPDEDGNNRESNHDHKGACRSRRGISLLYVLRRPLEDTRSLQNDMLSDNHILRDILLHILSLQNETALFENG